MYISYGSSGSYIKIMNINKQCSKLKISCFQDAKRTIFKPLLTTRVKLNDNFVWDE